LIARGPLVFRDTGKQKKRGRERKKKVAFRRTTGKSRLGRVGDIVKGSERTGRGERSVPTNSFQLLSSSRNFAILRLDF